MGIFDVISKSAIVGGAVGFLTGGPVGALVGAMGGQLFGGGGQSVRAPRDSYHPPVDYSDAMIVASENNKTTALAQIMAQQMAMQQASIDRELQTAANLELGLERLDTKLQVSKLEYLQVMQAEENRHAEAMIPGPVSEDDTSL